MNIKTYFAPRYVALYITTGTLISTMIAQFYEYTIIALPIGMMFIGVHLICSSIESLEESLKKIIKR